MHQWTLLDQLCQGAANLGTICEFVVCEIDLAEGTFAN